MKKQDIHVGRVYTDGKLGLRRVTAEGAEFKSYPEVADSDCLQYEVIISLTSDFKTEGHEPELGKSTRQSFAAWAKAEVPASSFDATLNDIRAQRARLSRPQHAFMRSLDPVECATATTSWECEYRELRVARALEEKGILRLDMRAPGRPFTVCLTPFGAALVHRIAAIEQEPTTESKSCPSP